MTEEHKANTDQFKRYTKAEIEAADELIDEIIILSGLTMISGSDFSDKFNLQNDLRVNDELRLKVAEVK